ncbi:hypothetical protein J2X04_001295 [Lysobacter niabensis]|uniref:Uncharacterized protein n=1 Tax=Agrilutibacter niabensis TaxID=380628 RepID=A0ABU1VNW7_9GAMM|nr:hypothetical protein [Lysobacter niabensis]MDR7098948.1 hypothetical protein [Lysobacter niabensis]
MKPESRILQLDVLGSFDFYTSVVSIDAVESPEFQRLADVHGPPQRGRRLTLEQFLAADRVLPLIAHELTHFIDATSTCWGLQHLKLLDLAYRAQASQREEDFYHLKAAYNHVRTLRLPAYYTLVEETEQEVLCPWTYQVSIGLRFTASGAVEGAVPVAFCKFATLDGVLLARSPLSPVSLLETSAMAQELQQRYALLMAVDGPEGLVEQRRQAQKALDYLYNHRITEYSACAHLVANYQQCTDVLAAYRLAGILSRLVLNFAPVSFTAIANSGELGAVFGVALDHQYAQRVRQGLLANDCGVLYYVLCAAMPADSFATYAAAVAGIERALVRLGTSIQEVTEHARAEVARIAGEVALSPSVVLRLLSIAGARNFDLQPPLSDLLQFQTLHLPQLLFGDCLALPMNGREDNLLENLEPDTCFDELYPLEQAIRNFADACV